MRNSLLILTIILSLPLASVAVAQSPEAGADPANSEQEKPEFQRRSLPADTFKPSEEISEDYPVPFPVDI